MTGFLASIKNEQEANIISPADVDIVDLKNVNDDGLGFVGINVFEKCHKVLPNSIISVTMGNDINPNNHETIKNLKFLIEREVDYVKIGLFDRKIFNEHKKLLKNINFKKTIPICVIFADHDFNMYEIEDIVSSDYQGIMIDTFFKEGKSTLELINTDQIEKFITTVTDYGKISGISGSLKINDIDSIINYNPSFLGFRGQLCDPQSSRKIIDPRLVSKVSRAMRSS